MDPQKLEYLQASHLGSYAQDLHLPKKILEPVSRYVWNSHFEFMRLLQHLQYLRFLRPPCPFLDFACMRGCGGGRASGNSASCGCELKIRRAGVLIKLAQARVRPM